MKPIAPLAALLVCATLFSCGNDTADTNTTDTAAAGTNTSAAVTEAETEDSLPPLGLAEDLDYEGYNYRMLTYSGGESDVLPDSETGNVVEDATYARIRAVEERLNVDLTVFGQGEWYNTDAMNTILANDDAYDLIFSHGRCAFAYAAAGAALDFNDIETIDLDAPWWNQDMRENFEIAGQLYVMGGSLSTTNIGSTFCVLFSNKLLADHDIEFPYQLVRDGKWTLDVMDSYVKQFSSDINGDGVIELTNDLMGLGTSTWGGMVARYYLAGTKIVTPNADGKPELTAYNEKVMDIFVRMNEQFDAKCAGINDEEFVNAFKGNHLAFIDKSLDVLPQMADMETNFGVLPMPKYDESIDRYYSLVEAGTRLCIIPITVSDIDRTGAITEAFAYYGEKLVIPAYYENALKNRYVRDEASIEMIEIIRNSQTYDLAYFNDVQFGGYLSSIGHDLAVDSSKTLTTLYEKGRKSVERLIEKSYQAYSDKE